MIGEGERAAAADVLSGSMLVHGPRTSAFEAAFAKRVGTRHAIAVSSCTAALHLSLKAGDIGPKDTVIVPAMTHAATAHAVEYCGARALFVDVDRHTGNIDVEAAAAAATGHPALRALMPVHYLGLPCSMDAIGKIARESGAIVIEDCALAIDATFAGMNAGSLGNAGCFSFYPVKHMTSIEGGMVTTDDDELAARIRKRRAFGYDRTPAERREPGVYNVDDLGLNFRMNEVEAAIGLVQLERLGEFQAIRATNAETLRAALTDIREIAILPERCGTARSSNYCINVVLPEDGNLPRKEVVATLSAAGIGTSVHYPVALPLSTYYRRRYGHEPGDFPVAEWLANKTISLPVGPHLDGDDMHYIADSLKSAISRIRLSNSSVTKGRR